VSGERWHRPFAMRSLRRSVCSDSDQCPDRSGDGPLAGHESQISEAKAQIPDLPGADSGQLGQ
jgi:hypothetical protein